MDYRNIWVVVWYSSTYICSKYLQTLIDSIVHCWCYKLITDWCFLQNWIHKLTLQNKCTWVIYYSNKQIIGGRKDGAMRLHPHLILRVLHRILIFCNRNLLFSKLAPPDLATFLRYWNKYSVSTIHLSLKRKTLYHNSLSALASGCHF